MGSINVISPNNGNAKPEIKSTNQIKFKMREKEQIKEEPEPISEESDDFECKSVSSCSDEDEQDIFEDYERPKFRVLIANDEAM